MKEKSIWSPILWFPFNNQNKSLQFPVKILKFLLVFQFKYSVHFLLSAPGSNLYFVEELTALL